MLNVRYVGLKDRETDCVAGTGITWVGKGDVQPVPDSAWAKMAPHTDVWELVADDPEQSDVVSLDAPQSPGLADAKSEQSAPSAAPDLYGMQTAELRELVKSRNLQGVDITQRGAALRQAVAAALKA